MSLQIGASDIVVLCGDSIMYQVNWIDLARQANAKYGVNKGPIWINGGQGGETSTGGASRIGSLTQQTGGGTFSPLHPTKAIVNWSINDISQSVPLNTSISNLTTILSTAKSNLGGAANILYLCPYITDPAQYAAVATYNAAMQTVCNSQGVAFVDLQAQWLARAALGYRDLTLKPDLVTVDHVHPQYTFMVPETTMTGKQIYASWVATGIQFV